MLDTTSLQQTLCEQLCAEIELHPDPESDVIAIETPWTFPDGDVFQIYANPLPGGFRLSDVGHVTNEIAYEIDGFSFTPGPREALLIDTLNQHGASYEDGEIFVEVRTDNVADGIFRIGQAMSAVYSLRNNFSHSTRSSFTDDLMLALVRIAGEGSVHRSYTVPELDNSANYPVDFKIDNSDQSTPLFVFGVHNGPKARLVTITLMHFIIHRVSFTNVLVFENQEEMPRGDLARLSDVGGEQVSSLASTDALERRIKRHLLTS